MDECDRLNGYARILEVFPESDRAFASGDAFVATSGALDDVFTRVWFAGAPLIPFPFFLGLAVPTASFWPIASLLGLDEAPLRVTVIG